MPQRPTDPDQEPIGEFLDRLVNGAQVSRRTVLQRFAAAGLTAGSASAFLAACGGVEGTSENKKTVDTSERQPPEDRPSGRSRSPTGRSTSTRRSSRRGRRTPAGSSSTSRTTTTTRSSTPRSARSSSRTSRSAARSSRRPTGWRRAGSISATPSRSTRRTSRTPRTSSRASRTRRTTRTATSRCRGSPASRASATTRRRPAASSRASTTSSTRSSRAASRCSASGATPPGLVLLGMGKNPTDGLQGRLHRGDREDRRGERQGPDPPLHRQRLHEGPRGGEPLGVRGVVGRPRAAAGRQPGPRVPRPRGGRDELVGQHAHAGERVRARATTAPRRS